MQRKTPKTYKLNGTTLSYVDTLSSSTGITATAVIEMAVAMLYRQMFGAEALLNQSNLTRLAGERAISSAEDRAPFQDTAAISPSTEINLPTKINVQERRQELGLSRVALARVAGVSEGTVRRFESGDYQPRLVNAEMVAKIAKGLQWTEQEAAQALGAKRFLIS